MGGTLAETRRDGSGALKVERRVPPFWDRPILAIESSCDETSAAVVVGREVRSNIVASQIEMHQKWGGVVPEAAARAHVESIVPVIQAALSAAGLEKVSAVAVTRTPGLVGALSVGLSAAKALAIQWGVPILGVHHLDGHLMSPWGDPSLEGLPYPHLCLTISGGHSEIIQVTAPGEYRLLGETLDDAAGEAFDKGARLLGLGYPGGKAIQEAAIGGNPHRYKLPRALRDDPFHFSFSGLKTAMLRLVQVEGSALDVRDAAASLQEAIVDVIATKAMQCAGRTGSSAVTLVGGVSANRALRDRLAGLCAQNGLGFVVPPFSLCTDNAGMIGLAGSMRLAMGERGDLSMDVSPGDSLPGLME